MDTQDYVFQEQLGSGLLSTRQGWRELDDWFAYARTLPTLEDELAQLVRPADMKRAIYVIHMPPYRLGLDKCADGLEVGSKAVYDFLLENQPLLALHGHIHESPEVSGRAESGSRTPRNLAKRAKAVASFVFFARFRPFRGPNAHPADTLYLCGSAAGEGGSLRLALPCSANSNLPLCQ